MVVMIKIFVKVKTRSKKEGVEKHDDSHYTVRVNSLPKDGEANERVILLLSLYFGCAKSSIILSKGFKNPEKTFLLRNTSLPGD